ncbi:hypothetical protein CPB86DRAFT_797590 [Serendipita vermifera]|nr:hypothetical protein CPB86DRAFT_797590 [Serendipita vermifera]
MVSRDEDLINLPELCRQRKESIARRFNRLVEVDDARVFECLSNLLDNAPRGGARFNMKKLIDAWSSNDQANRSILLDNIVMIAERVDFNNEDFWQMLNTVSTEDMQSSQSNGWIDSAKGWGGYLASAAVVFINLDRSLNIRENSLAVASPGVAKKPNQIPASGNRPQAQLFFLSDLTEKVERVFMKTVINVFLRNCPENGAEGLDFRNKSISGLKAVHFGSTYISESLSLTEIHNLAYTPIFRRRRIVILDGDGV